MPVWIDIIFSSQHTGLWCVFDGANISIRISIILLQPFAIHPIFFPCSQSAIVIISKWFRSSVAGGYTCQLILWIVGERCYKFRSSRFYQSILDAVEKQTYAVENSGTFRKIYLVPDYNNLPKYFIPERDVLTTDVEWFWEKPAIAE